MTDDWTQGGCSDNFLCFTQVTVVINSGSAPVFVFFCEDMKDSASASEANHQNVPTADAGRSQVPGSNNSLCNAPQLC